MKNESARQRGLHNLTEYVTLPYSTPELAADFLALLESDREKLGSPILRKDDIKPFKRLPNLITVYRGYRGAGIRIGVSWTLSKMIAEGFALNAAILVAEAGKPTGVLPIDYGGKTYGAQIYSNEEGDKLVPMLITGVCQKSDIVAYTNKRFEQEIILPPDKLANIVELPISDKARQQVEEMKRLDAQRKPFKRFRAESLEWILSNKQH